MRRFLATALLTAAALLQAACTADTLSEQQALVDRSALTVQDMMTGSARDPRSLLRSAQAVMICPRIFKAGFFFGGEGGGCVMLGRAGNGTWSYPAFYTIGSGSFGLQIGIEDNELIMMILTRRGLNAVLDSQIKLGATAGLAIATIGAGVQGSTTTAIGADIVAFSISRGLFGGISLEGSLMSSDSGADQSYYGQPLASRQIVMEMQGRNPGADPLRDVLTRYGGSDTAAPNGQAAPTGGTPAYPPQGAAPGYAPAYPGTASPNGAPLQPAPGPGAGPAPQYLTPPQAAGRGPVQEQSLAPPSR